MTTEHGFPCIPFSSVELKVPLKTKLNGKCRERESAQSFRREDLWVNVTDKTWLEMGPERLKAFAWMEGVFYEEINGQAAFGEYLGTYLT